MLKNTNWKRFLVFAYYFSNSSNCNIFKCVVFVKNMQKKFLLLTFILVALVKVLSKKEKKTCCLIKNSNSMSVALTHFSILMRHFWNQIDKSTFFFISLCYFLFYVFLKEFIRWIIFIQNLLTWRILI
jgi:hypothetical protein